LMLINVVCGVSLKRRHGKKKKDLAVGVPFGDEPFGNNTGDSQETLVKNGCSCKSTTVGTTAT